MPSELTEQHDAGETWEMFCPRFRYDTRGLPSERCPECGITRAEAGALIRVQQHLGTKGERAMGVYLATALGVICAVAAGTNLLDWCRVGVRNTELIYTTTVLVLCGVGIGIGVLQWGRLTAGKPLIHPWWIVGLFLLLTVVA